MNDQFLFSDSFPDHLRGKKKAFTSFISGKRSRQSVVTDTILIHSVLGFVTAPMIRNTFKFTNLPRPDFVHFPSSTKTDVMAGYIGMKSEKEALEAILILNNIPLFDTTLGIFRLKLDFAFRSFREFPNWQAKNLHQVLSNLT
jgi:hypothetical protein